MTAHAPESVTARPVARESDFPLPQEIDLSCRLSVGYMLLASVVWLVISLVFGVFSAIKMHAPGMLANASVLTYGRVAAVTSATFLYGFASQAAIAAALWLFARLGRTFLVLPRGGFVAALLWNLGVLLGVLGILGGDLTHFPAYEMPPWTSAIFLLAFIVLGLSALLTFVARNETTLFPSNWFLFAACFVFPWVLSVAYVFFGRSSIRGVMEPVIATWFANNFLLLWLGSVALAILFYFIPKLSQQPLYSYSMAVFGFWFYLLLATPSGFQNIAGLPNWMPTLSAVANTLMLLPALVIVVNWYQTWAGHNKAFKAKDRTSKYVVFAAMAFVVSILLRLALSWPAIDEVVGLTVFQYGASNWYLYGFVAMALFALIHYALPRVLDVEWPSPTLIGFHYGLTIVGLLISVLGLILGGYVEGNAINNPGVPFAGPGGVSRQLIPYIGMNTFGLFVLLCGQIALLLNILLMVKAAVVACCLTPVRKEVVR